MNRIAYARFARLTAIVATALVCGCAAMTATSPAPSGANSDAIAKSLPRVQDCGVLNTGTQSRFVCGGKVYTSFQLAKLREEAAKSAAGR